MSLILINARTLGSFSLFRVSLMEAKMTVRASTPVYLNWARERIDEINAVLASLETSASHVREDARSQANQLIADLRKQGADFQTAVMNQEEAGETTWNSAKSYLEAGWSSFETLVKRYVDLLDKQVERRQATFEDVATAQLKAWRQSAAEFQHASAELAVAKRAELDVAITRMSAEASEVEARFERLKQAGSESWAALSGALAESRESFDRANRAVSDAFNRAVSPSP
jgi:hypothetical protein